MYLKFNATAKMIAALYISLFMVSASQAAMPEPINPKDAVNMSFDQRLNLLKKVDAAILQSTPQEVAAYWKKHTEQLKALSPTERVYINQKMQANWNATTPEQKQAILTEQNAYFNALTPDQKAALRAYVSEMQLKQQPPKK
ncbi:DUF3106 domain-containing protein [Polynucleobacter paneuropaeus]|nr:DUF3106 domain-containing protein [Polynucleobacter paneuropaeus]